MLGKRPRRYALASGAAFGSGGRRVSDAAVHHAVLRRLPRLRAWDGGPWAGRGGRLRPAARPGRPADGARRLASAQRLGRSEVRWCSCRSALLILSFGVGNLARSWAYTMQDARDPGASLAAPPRPSRWSRASGGSSRGGRTSSWPRLLVVYLVYRRWPRLGRALLAGFPFALWLAAQRSLVRHSGYVLIYALLAPYLYLFVPARAREAGAKLLIWVWAPAVIAGAMTAFTSAAGYGTPPWACCPG